MGRDEEEGKIDYFTTIILQTLSELIQNFHFQIDEMRRESHKHMSEVTEARMREIDRLFNEVKR